MKAFTLFGVALHRPSTFALLFALVFATAVGGSVLLFLGPHMFHTTSLTLMVACTLTGGFMGACGIRLLPLHLGAAVLFLSCTSAVFLLLSITRAVFVSGRLALF